MKHLLRILLVAVVAGCGSNQTAGDSNAVAHNGRATGSTEPATPRDDETGIEKNTTSEQLSNANPVAALEDWQTRIERNELGEVIHVDLSASQVTDSELAEVAELAKLRVLHLFNTQITDAGLKHLKGMASLQELGPGGTQITDTGLVHLAGLTSLGTLDFSLCSKIEDQGLAHLKELTSLQELSLYKTQVTDAALVHLKVLTNLEHLVLPDLGTTPAGVAELQKALPNCEINRLDF